MALRKIVTREDEVLRKNCKPVEKFDEKLWQLLDDMAETMYKAEGYGLAAPLIGIIRKICVIDVGEGLIELINPMILEFSLETERGTEGCLSCPGEWGYVTRPKKVKFGVQDRNGEFYEKEVTDMFARCVCHETDHLKGQLFTDIADEMIDEEELEKE